MKILVVDDDRQIVKTTCDILRVKGHETIPAYSGEEGVAMLGSDRPDCVLMDIKMPGISGVEALKRMKEIAPALPVILVSAYATEDLLEEARQAGTYAILSKPLNIQMVLSFLDLLHQKENILIVDDDPNFCKTLKDILSMQGFRVETVTQAQEVMRGLENDRKLVVLLDLKLGEASGVDVLKQIRLRYPSMPVVMVTGYHQEMGDAIADGLQSGAYACLQKPLEIDALLRVIEEIRLSWLRNALI
ncbi:response regulator [Denitratisoma oestradiolicum]|nr:response regulator [Denitratisoma oestradiolicum]